jgi:N-methylhydantoinase B
MLERIELAQDSGGTGRHRGGLGVDFAFLVTEDSWVSFVVDGTLTRPWGLDGGGQGRPNGVALRQPDQPGTPHRGKAGRVRMLKGMTLELYTGGGGGYGAPAERDPESVHADIRDEYVSESAARAAYPHAFSQEAT